MRQKFGSYERDNETGLDFAQARYFSSIQGRFTSPDIPFADQFEDSPQSWNLYAYVRNNPLKYIDPLGLARYDPKGNWIGEYDGEYDKQTGLYWNKQQGLWESAAEFRFRRGQEQLVKRIGTVLFRLNYQRRFGNSDRTGAGATVGLAGAIALRRPSPPNLVFSGLLLVGAGLAYLTNYSNAPPPVLIDPNIEARKKDLKLVDYIADKFGVPRELLSDAIHWEKRTSGRGGDDNLGKEKIEELAREIAEGLKKLGEGEGGEEGKPDN